MIIKRNEQIEQFLLEEIQNKLGNNLREGLHLSDFLSPKQSYWQRTKPVITSKREIIYWLSGKAHESVFLNVSNIQHGKAKQWNDIWYTPDAYLNVVLDAVEYKDLLTEMKTSRRGFLVKEGEEEKQYEHYLKQLGYYCAMENVTKSGLFVWYLTMMDENRRNTDPDYFFYNVDFTEEELITFRKEIIYLRSALMDALESNDPSALPDCKDWMCFRKKSIMIEKPYCITCKNKEFQTDWGIKKHTESKTGKDHNIVHAKYDVIIEPRCKYAMFCKPEMHQNYLVWKEKNQGDDDFGMEDE
jgi:hypothetical protein